MEVFSRRPAAGVRGPRPSLAKERFWRDHVARQAAEGISVRAYCRRHALKDPSFYAWRRELAKRDRARLGAPARTATRRGSVAANPPLRKPARGPRAVGFVRLAVPPEGMPVGPVIEIVLPREVRVRVPDGVARSHLREVLAALGINADGNSGEESSSC